MTIRQKSGFTLIELLIVVGIIGLLATVLIAALINAISKREEQRAEYFIRQAVPSAITAWQDKFTLGSNDFPRSPNIREGGDYIDGNAVLFEEFITKPIAATGSAMISQDHYVEGEINGKKVFLDPWGHPYVYRNYIQRLSAGGGDSTYKGKRINSTYDLISRGPDGEYGTDDDITN